MRELERLHFEREQEMYRSAKEMIGAFQSDWLIRFEEFHRIFIELYKKLEEVDGEVEIIKGTFNKCKSKKI